MAGCMNYVTPWRMPKHSRMMQMIRTQVLTISRRTTSTLPSTMLSTHSATTSSVRQLAATSRFGSWTISIYWSRICHLRRRTRRGERPREFPPSSMHGSDLSAEQSTQIRLSGKSRRRCLLVISPIPGVVLWSASSSMPKRPLKLKSTPTSTHHPTLNRQHRPPRPPSASRLTNVANLHCRAGLGVRLSAMRQPVRKLGRYRPARTAYHRSISNICR